MKKDLKVNVVKIDNTYSFDTKKVISDSYYSSSKKVLYVNDELVNGNTVTLSEPIKSIKIYESTKVDSHVENFSPNENENLTIEQYNHKLKQLKSKIENSLEDEFEYRKFIRDYMLIQKDALVFVQDVLFEVVDMTDPKIPFVTLKRHLGGDVTDCTAVFDQQRFLINYIHTYLNAKDWSDEDKKGKNKYKTYNIYHYNEGMVNLYLEGSQLFDIRKFKYSDTLINVIKEKDSLEQWIKDKLDTYFENLRDNLTQNDLNKILTNILRIAEKVDSKVNTRNEHMNLLREIKAHIKK